MFWSIPQLPQGLKLTFFNGNLPFRLSKVQSGKIWHVQIGPRLTCLGKMAILPSCVFLSHFGKVSLFRFLKTRLMGRSKGGVMQTEYWRWRLFIVCKFIIQKTLDLTDLIVVFFILKASGLFISLEIEPD